jgi:hypothetical protein
LRGTLGAIVFAATALTGQATMNGVIESVIKFIESQNWTYKWDQDKPVVYTGVTGKNGHWKCVAAGGGNGEYVLFLSTFPGIVPANRHTACSELLTRINFGLTHGCFELDFEDGEIRYRTCVPILNGQLAPQAVEYLVFTNLFAVDRFFAPIMKVVFADVSPKEALRPAKTQYEVHSRFELN